MSSEIPEKVQSIPRARKEEEDKINKKDESPEAGSKIAPKQAADPGTIKEEAADKSKDGERQKSPEIAEAAMNKGKKNNFPGQEKIPKESSGKPVKSADLPQDIVKRSHNSSKQESQAVKTKEQVTEIAEVKTSAKVASPDIKVKEEPVAEISKVKALSSPAKVASPDVKVKEEPITEVPPFSPNVPIGWFIHLFFLLSDLCELRSQQFKDN